MCQSPSTLIGPLTLCLLPAVADLQRMFPTPPSLEQHPAFSPIMTYRDTPSQEPPASGAAAGDHLPPLASTQLADYRMETEEGVASPRQEDIKVRLLPADLRSVSPTQIAQFPSAKVCNRQDARAGTRRSAPQQLATCRMRRRCTCSTLIGCLGVCVRRTSVLAAGSVSRAAIIKVERPERPL